MNARHRVTLEELRRWSGPRRVLRSSDIPSIFLTSLGALFPQNRNPPRGRFRMNHCIVLLKSHFEWDRAANGGFHILHSAQVGHKPVRMLLSPMAKPFFESHGIQPAPTSVAQLMERKLKYDPTTLRAACAGAIATRGAGTVQITFVGQ